MMHIEIKPNQVDISKNKFLMFNKIVHALGISFFLVLGIFAFIGHAYQVSMLLMMTAYFAGRYAQLDLKEISRKVRELEMLRAAHRQLMAYEEARKKGELIKDDQGRIISPFV